jgi:hypothetical protein
MYFFVFCAACRGSSGGNLPRIVWRQFAAFRGFFGGKLPRIVWRQFAACRLSAQILWRQLSFAEDLLAGTMLR